MTEPSDRKLTVDHVTYNIGTVDSLDYSLRGCLPTHRDALLDARMRFYPDAPTEGRDHCAKCGERRGYSWDRETGEPICGVCEIAEIDALESMLGGAT